MAGPCEYVITFKPLWMVLSAFGAWPQRVTKGGRLVRSARSPLTAFTAVVLPVCCWRSWVALQYHVQFQLALPPGNVPLTLLNVQYAVYVLCLGIMVYFIVETGRNARYAASWQEFQPELQRVCGAPMRNDSLRRRLKITVGALTVGWNFFLVVSMLYAGDDGHVTIAEVIYQGYGTTFFALASTNWRMHCAFFLHASTMFVTALREALHRDTLPRQDVVRLVRVWLRLRDLVNEGVRSIERSAFLDIGILMMTNVLGSFNIMYIVFNGLTKIAVFLAVSGGLALMTFVRIFNVAHRVNDMLDAEVRMALARTRVSRYSKETLQELNSFRLILNAHPVRIKLFGFLPINRNVLGALGVMILTYIVVLVQYSVG